MAKNYFTPVPDGEISDWVENAARHFGITPNQFLMMCLQDAWEKLYNKTFTWREFTLIEREKLAKLESQQCDNHDVTPGECGIRCKRR